MKQFILTCEHGGNSIPQDFERHFANATEDLNSHRGYDLGALEIAQHLKEQLNFPLFFSTTSRLLVELNRSLHHPSLFSRYTKDLDDTLKNTIIKTHYTPYRLEVENYIQKMIENGNEPIHISVHSFTPVLNQKQRNCEIGLLYDPQRHDEKQLCNDWKNRIIEIQPSWRVRKNYPYRGIADGFTTYLRKKFASDYIGIELEVNQKLLTEVPDQAKKVIGDSLTKCVLK